MVRPFLISDEKKKLQNKSKIQKKKKTESEKNRKKGRKLFLFRIKNAKVF